MAATTAMSEFTLYDNRTFLDNTNRQDKPTNQLVDSLLSQIRPSIGDFPPVPSLLIPSINSCFRPVQHAAAASSFLLRTHENTTVSAPENRESFLMGSSPSTAANSQPIKQANSRKIRVAKDILKLEWGTTSCHQCHTKKCPEKVIHCTSLGEEICRKRYCLGCLERKYGEQPERFSDPEVLKNWICPFCRGICNCPPCFKKKNPIGAPSPPSSSHASPTREEGDDRSTDENLSPGEEHISSKKRELTTSNLIMRKKRRISVAKTHRGEEEEDALQVLEHLKDGPFHFNQNRSASPEKAEESKNLEETMDPSRSTLNEKLTEIFRHLEQSRQAVCFLKTIPQEFSRNYSNSSRGLSQLTNHQTQQYMQPMDFSIVRHKLERKTYASYVEFYNDFVLMVENLHETCDVILPQVPLQADQLLEMCASELLKSKDDLVALEEEIRNHRPVSPTGQKHTFKKARSE